MNILFIGDIVGKLGRKIVEEELPILKEKYHVDFVVANGENATHGKGLSIKHYHELIAAGIDCITMGNHYLRVKDVFSHKTEYTKMVRPANMYPDIPGNTYLDFSIKGKIIRVINVLGRGFMNGANYNPFDTVEKIMGILPKPQLVLVDFHAESTAEKMIMAKGFDGQLTAVVGTHTHVQTNDPRILPKGTAFITDLGMCGYYDGILGVKSEDAINLTWRGIPSKFEMVDSGSSIFNGLVMEIDDEMDRAVDMKLINIIKKD
ncbi:MAG: TIGR00282 family metallophosphoesterase, partial [Bacilli bacterium]|nr:TIGR00282 family metallophosphoesterase [Bacilli bacterium]